MVCVIFHSHLTYYLNITYCECTPKANLIIHTSRYNTYNRYIQSQCKDSNRHKSVPGDANDSNWMTHLSRLHDIHLNHVFLANFLISTRTENLHAVFSCKPISKEFFDTPGCIIKWEKHYAMFLFERVTLKTSHV